MQQPGTAMMNMAGGAVGAPVMGAGQTQVPQSTPEYLNTYIYDHFVKLKMYDLARQIALTCPIKVEPKPKKEMNGDSDMDMDSKDKMERPDDLPWPDVPRHYSENSFLFDWWNQFWDIFAAARHRPVNNPASNSYITHNMSQMKMRQQMNPGGMMAGANNMMRNPQQFANMQANGMNMQKQAMANANRGGMQQQMMAASKMQQNNIQDSDRPQSPGSNGNAPSPSKRPRVDDGSFNGQPVPAGRGQQVPGGQMPGAPNGMMMQNGMPTDMNQMAFPNGQQKMDMGAGGPQGMEGFPEMMAQQQRQMANGTANPGAQGNHALQDYQMQLMLLEQQNKKRLLMARQEQDNVNHMPGNGNPNPANMQFAAPNVMSPSNGGRPGQSPNPNEQIKRMATPKMGPGNMPGSPAMPGEANRGSPMPGGFDQNGMPPNMQRQMFAQQGMMAQGQAPSSHPNFNGMPMANMPQNMDQMRMAAAQGRLVNGQPWPQGGQPMMQTPSQQGAQVGTPQQRNAAMPPPPAPAGVEQQQRTQPSSPAQPAANNPPTPSQTAKAAPKGKKEPAKKKGAAKKDAATPAASEAPAATPIPSTPITPMHQNSFGNKTGANAPAGGAVPPPQATNPVGAMDPSTQPFGDLSGGPDFDLNFTDSGPDVLENFDFDSFLHNTDDGGNFGTFDFMNMGELGDATAGS